MTKPFSLEELLARVPARMRDEDRVEPTVLEAGPVALDLRTRRATVEGEVVPPTAREFTYVERSCAIAIRCSKEQLLTHVGGMTSIRLEPGRGLRRLPGRKLSDERIETVWGWATAAH